MTKCQSVKVSRQFLKFANFATLPQHKFITNNKKFKVKKDMKSVNTVRTSTVMVARWSRLKSRIVSLYSRNWLVIAPMLFVAFGLFGVNEEAWGNTLNVSGTGFKDIVSSNVATLGGNHVSFKFSGSTVEYSSTLKNVYLGSINNNSSGVYTISWTRNSGCTLNITKIQVKGSASANGTMQLSGGSESGKGTSFDVSTTSISGNSATLTCRGKAGKILGIGVISLFYVTDIIITYTITPSAPGVNPTTASVDVTLDTNDKKKVNLTNYFSVSDEEDFRSLVTYAKSGGSFDGTYFYATDSGSYTVNAYIDAKKDCHEKSATSSNLTITVNPRLQSFNVTNGSVDISKTGDVVNLDLRTLVSNYSGYSNATPSFAKVTKSGYASTSNATISGYNFSATATGTYRVKVTYAGTKQYRALSKEFDVVVGKRTPMVVFAKPEHIYSGNTLSDMAKVQYNGVDVPLNQVDFDYSFDNPSWFSLNPSNDKQIMVSTEYGTEQTAKLYVTTEETDYYTSVTADTTYHLEVKRTPEFYLNGVLLDKTQTTNLYLEIDSTAQFTFDKITSGFEYPNEPSHFTYNSTTGVLMATVAGDETFFFNEPGDSITFQHQCNLRLYVRKHETELTTSLKNNDVWMVDDSVAESSIYELVNGDTNVPVVVSSDSTHVIRKVNGKWTAVGAGIAHITISQAASDKWTGDTITRTINVNRYDPVFDWSGLPDTLNFNTTFVNPVRSTSDGVITYASNKSAVTVTNDSTTLHTAETADNAVTITAIQKPTYKYEGKTETKTVKVLKLRNHVKIEVKSNETYLAVRNKTEGDVAWVGGNDNAIRLGGSSTDITKAPAWDWYDKYIDVKFEGVPKTISFTTGVTSDAATAKVRTFMGAGAGNNNGFWYMIEYPEGESANTLWTENDNANPGDISRDLKPNTNKVRICYTGNFAGYVKNLTITERTELTASTNDIAFGDNFRVGDAATECSFTIDWYNLNPLTVTSNNPKFVVLTPTIASKKDSFATNVPIRIQYLHTVEGTNDSGTITVTNTIDGKSVSVTVHGKTFKRTQTLSWLENYDNESPVMNVADTLKLAKATSGLPVTYLSSDTTKAVVINDTLVYAKGLGEVTITAKQSGNDSWGAAEDISQTFRVTQKIRQILVWSQDLTRLNPDNEVKRDTLTARVMVLNQESGELEEVPEQTAKIQYTITGQAGIVSLSDSIITYTETEGSTAIRAYVPEDETYAAVSLTKQVRVRRPANGCDDPLLPTNLQTPYEIFTGTLDETHVDISLDRTQGEPESMIFYHRGEYWWLLNKWSFYEGELQVQQYVNNQWSDVLYYVTPTVGESHESARIPLDRRATMIRITRPKNGQGYHYIDSIAVFRKKYIESATTAVNYGTVDRGDEHSTDITVNYSNCKSDLFVTHKNAQIALKRNNSALTSVGIECGEINSFTFRMTFTPDVPGEMKDTIVIADAVGGLQLAIPVSANIKKSSQSITWTQDTAIVTTTNLTLAASATSGESVTYSVVSGSDVATVNENTGVVTIIKNGTVTFRATQTGTDYYNFITKDRTFTIEKVTPTITKNPKASDVTLPATLAASTWTENGTASVAGTFAWTNPSTELVAEDVAYEVTFTPENTNWYNTTTCMVTPHVSKASQTIDWSFNATEMYGNANYTFDATASSGLTVTYSSSKNDVATVNDQNKLVLHKAGESVTITATQAGDETYLPVSESRTFTILYWEPTIVENPVGGTMYVGHVLSDASLTGGRAEVGGQEVEGSFVWENANTATINVPGPATHNVVFVPQNGNFFAQVVCENIPLTVLRYQPHVTSNTLSADGIEFPLTLEHSSLHGEVTTMDYSHVPYVEVTGHVEWKAPSTILRPGNQTATALFVPDNTDWYANVEIPVSVQVTGGYVFNGNNDSTWTEQGNWAGNLIPTGTDDPVLINDNVEITTEVTVGALTIKEGVDLVVKEGGKLTIGNYDSENREAYGNLHVENGGKVIFGEGIVHVNDFTLEAKLGDADNLGMSGQVSNPATLKVRGNAYFDLALDPSGECSPGWYTFTVPFPVDVMTGITRFDNTTHLEKTIKNEVNYAIMDYSENRRVVGGYGWKKYRSVMQPGKCYTMTIDDVDNVYRFKMVKDGTFNNQMNEALAYTEVDSEHNGWNGLGNGTLAYADLSASGIDKVHVYSHSTNSYTPVYMDEYTYVVGSTYFVKAVEANSEITYTHSGANHTLRAPQRSVETISEFALSLTNESTKKEADRLYVGASEDALDIFEAGHELTKFATPTDAKTAQIWANAYGLQLCDIEMPLVNEDASCTLGLFAPKAGQYTLAVKKAPEDAALYLTYNDNIIWDLTASPYVFDLTKGATNGYGLRIEAKRGPQVWTGIDSMEADGQTMRKVIIDNKVYVITPEGKMYDIVGKSVKY